MSKKKLGKMILLRFRNQHGATAVIAAVLLVVLFCFAALAIDIGYLYAARNELQNIADASALAAARQLGEIYDTMPPGSQGSFDPANSDYWPDEYTTDLETIKTAAKDIAALNPSLGLDSAFVLDDADIVLGRWDSDLKILDTSSPLMPDAVRVISRRDGEQPVITFFASIFKLFDSTNPNSEFDVSAVATAGLDCPGTAPPGEVDLPIALSENWFDDDYCGDTISFAPTDSCASWHSFDASTASTPVINGILEGMADGSYESPETIAGKTEYNFNNGTLGNAVLPNLYDLYDQKKDPVTGEWEIHVAVYQDAYGSCDPPTNWTFIVGFATATITGVAGPPPVLDAQVNCEMFFGGAPGGGCFGTYGTIAHLVE